MALHIIPAGELHQTNPGCQCRPRNVRYARRTAWKHQATAALSVPTRVEMVRTYGLSPAEVDTMPARRLQVLAASLPGRR